MKQRSLWSDILHLQFSRPRYPKHDAFQKVWAVSQETMESSICRGVKLQTAMTALCGFEGRYHSKFSKFWIELLRGVPHSPNSFPMNYPLSGKLISRLLSLKEYSAKFRSRLCSVSQYLLMIPRNTATLFTLRTALNNLSPLSILAFPLSHLWVVWMDFVQYLG